MYLLLKMVILQPAMFSFQGTKSLWLYEIWRGSNPMALLPLRGVGSSLGIQSRADTKHGGDAIAQQGQIFLLGVLHLEAREIENGLIY